MSLTDKQKGLIRESWAKVDHRAHGMVFYEKLFAAHPEYLPKFKKFPKKDAPTLKKEEDPAFVAQAVATFSAIDRVISKLDNLEDMTRILKDMGKRHVKYGVFEPEFIAVQPVVIDTLNAGLGGMSPELQNAWETALKIICSVIVQGQS
ncbi:neuroglobin-1-like [Lineus longissimus]|uniref:neuroglobin-1-like n=1 Tax=Lineus longissimus TaxID=88925 RepID=UPI002B4EB330